MDWEMFKELESLFESSTIKPSFDLVHVILSLFIFDENREGIGRYRLQKELIIGEGTAKSLIKKLSEKTEFLVLTDKTKQKGHILTEKGIQFLNKIKKKIPILKQGDISLLKNITIESYNITPYFCLVKNAAKEINNGIEQRDAAIKVEGKGATCLIYDGNNLVFPSRLDSENSFNIVEDDILNYFKNEIDKNKLNLETNDVIIIGLGESNQKSRLAAINSALTLLKK
jgi:predicted transcriptional regulator